MTAWLLCATALAGGVRPLPDVPPSASPDDAARAVVDVEVIALDAARHLVAAKQRLADGRVLLAVTDVARDVPFYTGLVEDEHDLARALSDVRMTAGVVRVEASGATLAVPTADGTVDVAIEVRPPTPAEFATDPRIDAWRAARVAADRPYASTEILLVLFTVSGRIVADDVFEAAAGRTVELTVPAAYVARGALVFVEQARAAPGRDAWVFSPLVDLDAALARLDELPRSAPLVAGQGELPAAATLPPPDEPTETREPDVAETICCGLPVFGGICAGMWCLNACENAFKTRR